MFLIAYLNRFYSCYWCIKAVRLHLCEHVDQMLRPRQRDDNNCIRDVLPEKHNRAYLEHDRHPAATLQLFITYAGWCEYWSATAHAADLPLCYCDDSFGFCLPRWYALSKVLHVFLKILIFWYFWRFLLSIEVYINVHSKATAKNHRATQMRDPSLYFQFILSLS